MYLGIIPKKDIFLVKDSGILGTRACSHNDKGQRRFPLRRACRGRPAGETVPGARDTEMEGFAVSDEFHCPVDLSKSVSQ